MFSRLFALLALLPSLVQARRVRARRAFCHVSHVHCCCAQALMPSQMMHALTSARGGMAVARSVVHTERHAQHCLCMRCRNNLKKDKRIRNRVNAYRFKSASSGPKRFNTFADRAAAKIKETEDGEFLAKVRRGPNSPRAPRLPCPAFPSSVADLHVHRGGGGRCCSGRGVADGAQGRGGGVGLRPIGGRWPQGAIGPCRATSPRRAGARRPAGARRARRSGSHALNRHYGMELNVRSSQPNLALPKCD